MITYTDFIKLLLNLFCEKTALNSNSSKINLIRDLDSKSNYDRELVSNLSENHWNFVILIEVFEDWWCWIDFIELFKKYFNSEFFFLFYNRNFSRYLKIKTSELLIKFYSRFGILNFKWFWESALSRVEVHYCFLFPLLTLLISLFGEKYHLVGIKIL